MTDRRWQKINSVLADRQPDLTVLAESLHKPRNFSAIVRTCDAVGINELHAVPGDEGMAIHWKTSQGAEKWVKVHSHDDLSSACLSLKDRGFQLVAAHLSEEAVDYRDLDYTQPTALVIGTELFGVSQQALDLSDRQVTIPMKGMTQSLNVSVACAIVLYEAMRQREASGTYGERRISEELHETQRFEWAQPAVAKFCRQRNLDYPELDEEGNVVGTFPRR
jgi:tRNA (guanosine-2'-O-)-methyltransferase